MYHGRITPVSRTSRCHQERDRPVSSATSMTRAARWRPPPANCRSSRAAQCASRAAPSFPAQARSRSRGSASRGGSRGGEGGGGHARQTPPPRLALGRLSVGGRAGPAGRGGGGGERRPPHPPLLSDLERRARLDRGPACEGGGEALEPVRPTAES